MRVRRDEVVVGNMKTSTLDVVENLNAKNIGDMIRFRQWMPGLEIEIVVTAELRQISAVREQVTLAYGLGAERAITLPFGSPILLNPDDSYGDVETLPQVEAR